MGDRKVSGKLWITTAGEGTDCPLKVRRTWHQIDLEVPEELAPEQPDESRWSISTEHGETFEP